jgi:DNA-binding MarR family transcriptional regulator
MERKHEFFAHAVKANLTGEQSRVLMCLLASEYDGVMGVKQNAIAQELDLTESNVSRSIKALTEAGLISKKVTKGYDGRPVFHIEKAFC